DGASRRLVDAARLHPDVPVLHEVDAADPVLAADAVHPLQERDGAEPLAVDGDGVPRLELDLDHGRHVGRLLGCAGGRATGSRGSPPWYGMEKGFRSMESGRAGVVGTGMPCRSA